MSQNHQKFYFKINAGHDDLAPAILPYILKSMLYKHHTFRLWIGMTQSFT